MVATPPVWRRTSIRAWRVNVGLYVVALVAGAVLLGTLLDIVGAIAALPTIVVGITALVAAGMAAGLLPAPPSSPWRVPRSWSTFGERPFVLVFGLALGAGVLTALPSFGFYVLLAWGLTAGLQLGLPAFVAFAGGRAAPVLFAAVFWRGDEITEGTSRLRRGMRRIRSLEAIVLGAAAGILLG